MTKQWDNEYLTEAFTDEIALAKVHRRWWRTYVAPTVLTIDAPLVLGPRASTPFGGSANSPRLTFSAVVPKTPPHWRRSWGAAGPLSTELGLSIRHDPEEGTVSVSAGSGRRNVTEAYAEHPSQDAATWAAITRAAIRLLSEARSY